MANTSARQQVIDTIKEVETILVTVNSDPTVDELSAALGFTLLVNKLNKRATAVFSGAIPPAIQFLDPQKTFEDTVNSLRDFIIALDKEKADHLRYKVDGDLVKIFITPYHTTISEKDLEYSSGDYNVEMVVALGAQDEADLDKALQDHGRILHDASVVSVSIGSDKSSLGTLQWHIDDASSYSEVMAGLADNLREDKNLLDEQISTAFLTGIVAATERFSNDKTSSSAMTIAAQLMAAGANQQLIAVKLEEAEQAEAEEVENVSEEIDIEPVNDQPEAPVADKTDDQAPEEPIMDRPAADGTMVISHTKKGDVDEVAAQVAAENQKSAAEEAERKLAETLALQPAAEPVKAKKPSLQEQLAAEVGEVEKPQNSDELPPVDLPSVFEVPAKQTPEPTDIHTDNSELPKPHFGGVLNATSEQAAEDARLATLEDQNKTILNHDKAKYIDSPPSALPALNSFNNAGTKSDEPPSVDPLKTAPNQPAASLPVIDPINPVSQDVPNLPPLPQLPPLEPYSMQFEAAPTPEPAKPPVAAEPPASQPLETPTLQELDASVRSSQTDLQNASSAVNEALNSAVSTQDHLQSGIPNITDLPPLPAAMPPTSGQLPDMQLPPIPEVPSMGLPPLPPALPPLDQSQMQPNESILGNMLPPLPEVTQPVVVNQASVPPDPGQFQIPTPQP
jgi:hypothetical protein